MKKTKKISNRGSKLAEEKSYGPEPIFTKEPSSIEIIRAFSWYSALSDDPWKTSRDYIISFLKEQKAKKDIIENVRSYPPYKLPVTVGWVCRQMSKNSVLPLDIKRNALLKVKEAAESSAKEIVTEENQKPIVSPQERLARKTSEIIGVMEEYIDSFIAQYKMPEKKPYDILVQEQASAPIAERIIKKYEPLLEEINLALSNKDKELTEAYSLTKPQYKAYSGLVKTIIDDARRLTSNVKAARKPRAKKAKSADAIVKSVKYKKDDATYKITSINPINILGAKQVWLFNTKTRYLTSLVSDASGLTVKGTSVFGIDEKLSQSKKIRKPDETLKQLLSAGKVSLRTFMDEIKSKPGVPKNRINSDTIIVKSIK